MSDGPQGHAYDPYTAPAAPVDDAVAAPSGQPVFFASSLLKLIVMSLVTLALYHIYWSYKNWKAVSLLTGQRLNAPIRAFFFPVTSYFLFRCIEEEGRKRGVDVSANAGFLALALFLLTTMQRLPDPYWVVGLLAFLPLLPMQSLANEINRRATPDADPNRRFRWWNVVAVVVGGLVLAAAIGSIFLDGSVPK
jgi:hypothetical protein